LEDIGVVTLMADKITGTGPVEIPIIGAKWPVYYTQGDRSLELAPVAYFTVDVKAGPAPLSVHFQDLSINVPTSWTWSFPGGTPSSSNLQNPVISYNTEGVYQVSLTCSNGKGNNSVTKTGYINVSLGNSVPDLNNSLISWYPNPVNDKLFIQSANDFRLKIFNLTGSLLVDVTNEKKLVYLLFKEEFIYSDRDSRKLITDKIIVE
jgi:PKD repeat protein